LVFQAEFACYGCPRGGLEPLALGSYWLDKRPDACKRIFSEIWPLRKADHGKKICRTCYDRLDALVALDTRRESKIAAHRVLPGASEEVEDAEEKEAAGANERAAEAKEEEEEEEEEEFMVVRVNNERLYKRVPGKFISIIRAMCRGQDQAVARAFQNLPKALGTGDPLVFGLSLRFEKEYEGVRKGCLAWKPHSQPLASLAQLKDAKGTLVNIAASLKQECPTLHAALRLASDPTFHPNAEYDAEQEALSLANAEAERRRTGILSMALSDDDNDSDGSYSPGDDSSVGSGDDSEGGGRPAGSSDEEEAPSDEEEAGSAQLDGVGRCHTRSSSEQRGESAKEAKVLMRHAAKQDWVRPARLAILIGQAAFNRHKHLSATTSIVGCIQVTGQTNIFERGLMHLLGLATAANTSDGHLRSLEFDPMEAMPAAQAAVLRDLLEKVRARTRSSLFL
jgi:hypothetical protein